VGPEHIAAARERLAGTRPGRRSPDGGSAAAERNGGPPGLAPGGWASPPAEPWRDAQGRGLYPLDFPDLSVDSG
jgi:hypothetical protein